MSCRFDDDTRPVYDRSADTAPLPRLSPRDTDEPSAADQQVSAAEPMSPDVSRFKGLNDTITLHRQGKALIKRGPVSPFEDEAMEAADDAARRVRFQPSGPKAAAAPDGARPMVSVFAQPPGGSAPFHVIDDTVADHDTARSVRGSSFAVREDTEVLAARGTAGGDPGSHAAQVSLRTFPNFSVAMFCGFGRQTKTSSEIQRLLR